MNRRVEAVQRHVQCARCVSREQNAACRDLVGLVGPVALEVVRGCLGEEEAFESEPVSSCWCDDDEPAMNHGVELLVLEHSDRGLLSWNVEESALGRLLRSEMNSIPVQRLVDAVMRWDHGREAVCMRLAGVDSDDYSDGGLHFCGKVWITAAI